MVDQPGIEFRRKIARLPMRFLMGFLRMGTQLPDFVCFPVLHGAVPADCRVVSAQVEWDRNCLGLVLEHPSFDVVGEGQTYPEVEEIVQMKWIGFPVISNCIIVQNLLTDPDALRLIRKAVDDVLATLPDEPLIK